MLTTLVTMATLAVAQLPEPLQLPSDLEGARVEVTLQATSNHFAVENASPWVQLLLVGYGELPPRVVRLAPGTHLLYSFPRGLAEDVSVEVIALDESGWRNSGAARLGDIHAATESAAWIQAGPDRSQMWILGQDHQLSHLAPTGQLVPRAWFAAHPELSVFEIDTHVPVPLPSEGKKSSKPPVIEKKKLPPV